MLPELTTKEKIIKTRRTVKRQKNAFRITEKIASKDHNNLYITSSFFKDKNKYEAFCAFYAVMRLVDDRIDNLPLSVKQNEVSLKNELKVVDAWEQVVISCYHGTYPTAVYLEGCEFVEVAAVCESLIAAFKNFPVSILLWTNFFKAMQSDLVSGEFKRWSDFLEYAEGATVAPTTIYLYLIASHRNNVYNSYELPEGFNLIKCGHYLGIFAYLGHIIRDLSEDIKSALTRLCITREDMNVHDVTPEILQRDALKNQASLATNGLVIDILQRARRYLLRAKTYVAQVQDLLESDGHFILELIITMYERIISKIESTGYDPMAGRHLLSKKEKADIIRQIAARTEFILPKLSIL
jgi:phytoene synthase